MIGAKGYVLGYATSISVSEVNALSNQERTARGLPAYSLNSQLNQAAQAKAQDMFAKNYWAHTAPDGTQPWAFIAAAGYSYSLAGENLAKDFNTSAGVVSGWMNSPAHQANVLSSSYKDVGYAVVNGTLLGAQTTLVVAMYAAPTASAGAAAAPPAAAPKATAPQAPAATAPAPAPAAPVAETTPPPTPAAVSPTPANSSPEPKVESASTQVQAESRYQVTSPQSAYRLLTWEQKAVILILSTLALLFILKHTLIWRRQKRGYRHIWLRAYPLAQASLLALGIILVIGSGAGVIL